MNQNYAPQRRKLLALQSESVPETGLVRQPGPGQPVEQGRQTALAVPESVRALGEPLDPFFEACGGRKSLSISVRRRDSGSAPETYVFHQPFVLVGRCPECDLHLADRGVSFRHVYLQLIGGRWLFVDLAGVSGTVAEKGQGTSGWFDPGSELTVGPYTITAISARQHSAAESGELIAAPVADLPAFELEFVNGRGSTRGRRSQKISTSVTLVGSSRQCDLWLRDDSISKVHAGLVLTPRGLWVVDLLGRDGLHIDGRPAYWKQVHNGSLLQFGRFQFRVRFAGAGRQAAGRDQDPPAPEVVIKPAPRASSGGNLSEDSVMALFQHITEMQTQFFEHSQLQMQFMAQMLAHLGRSQQVTVRQDLERIDEIGRELQEIKAELANPPRGTGSQRKRKSPRSKPASRAGKRPAVESPRTGDEPDAPGNLPDMPKFEAGAAPPAFEPATHEPDAEPSISRADKQSTGDTVPEIEQPAGTRPAREYAPPPSSNEAHARLTQRMARLAQERNNRWRRILSAFGRKSDG